MVMEVVSLNASLPLESPLTSLILMVTTSFRDGTFFHFLLLLVAQSLHASAFFVILESVGATTSGVLKGVQVCVCVCVVSLYNTFINLCVCIYQ
jgi:hypothetical protein